MSELSNNAIELASDVATLDTDIDDRQAKLTKLETKLAELKADTTSPVDKLAAAQTKTETEIASTTRAIELLTERRTVKLQGVWPLLDGLEKQHATEKKLTMKTNREQASELLETAELKQAMRKVVAAFRYCRDSGSLETTAGFNSWLGWYGQKLTDENNDAIIAEQDSFPPISPPPEKSETLMQLERYRHRAEKPPGQNIDDRMWQDIKNNTRSTIHA